MKIHAPFNKSTVDTIEKEVAAFVVLLCIGFAVAATVLDLIYLVR
jgi:hypothetical protein